MTRRCWIGICAAGLVASAAAQDTGVDSTLWTATAAEHDAAYVQAYTQATLMLDKALKDKKWTAALEQKNNAFRKLPPAIVLDIDETILDNTPSQARLVTTHQTFTPEAWDRWVKEAAAKPLPGALEFTQHAASRGITVFYVTNRDTPLKAATLDNLKNAGFPLKAGVDTLYCRGDRPEWKSSDKGLRRAEIASKYRILMLFGDDFNDFLSGAPADWKGRRATVAQYREYWGRKWFLLPDPMYGSWESAAVAGQSGNRVQQKYEALKDLTGERTAAAH